MKRIVITMGLMLVCIQHSWTSAASLKGTVKNSTGSAVAGVKVSLAQNKSTTTTDAQGVFTLTATKAVQLEETAKHLFKLFLAGNMIVISPAFSNARGNVDIFSSDGRKNASIPFCGTSEGKQTVNLPEFVSGLSIIRVTIGNETFTQTLVCLGSSNRYLNNDMTNATTAGMFSLTKSVAAAAVDTLIATKTGFKESRVSVDSYDKIDIAIIIEDDEQVGEIPLVYNKEWVGADCPKPTLVADPTTLPGLATLPDPFLMDDGKTRITTKEQWRCRRSEIKAILEKYETGDKPGKPSTFKATLSGNKISITCGENGKTFTMSAIISRPAGAPNIPIPAIINKGSLNFDFAAKNIATISWNEGDVVSQNGARTSGNFYSIYPTTGSGGHFIRWAWGVSRIIDALEALPEANIDVKHIAVSGCSYQGKQALYSGAFDERIALTVVHESGGGGTMCWRYGDYCADRDKVEVENLHVAQGCNWYAEILGKYKPTSVSPNTLPFDQHELIGMIAPRAVLCLESTLIARMGAEAAHMSAVGARRIYAALGITDRIGVSESNVNHCSWDAGYSPDLAAFVDKFLLGKDAKTGVLESKFTSVDTTKYLPWTTPVLK